MIGQSLRLSTIRGIQVGVHYSWFILFLLITFSLVARFAGQHPRWTMAEHYVVAFLTSLLFFVSILLHELAHSFVALAKGIPVRAITLFVFGGVAQIGREPDRPAVEFQIAIAGPIASFVLAFAFQGLAAATEDRFEHFAALADWLATINLALAVFNLIPGFPLDGGRIFRAAVWQVTGSLTKATRIAARSGQLFAYAFMFGGIAIGFTAKDIWGQPLKPAHFTLPAGAAGGVKLGHDSEHLFKTVATGVGGTPMPVFREQRSSPQQAAGYHRTRTFGAVGDLRGVALVAPRTVPLSASLLAPPPSPHRIRRSKTPRPTTSV